MTLRCIAGVGFWIVIASAGVMGQQRIDTPGERVLVRTYPAGGVVPSRGGGIRTADGRGAARRGSIRTPGLGGRVRPSVETVIATLRSGAEGAPIKRDL